MLLQIHEIIVQPGAPLLPWEHIPWELLGWWLQ